MKGYEKIPVLIKIEKGKTICICHAANRRCGSSKCERDIVTRDKFRGWEKEFARNKYGQ